MAIDSSAESAAHYDIRQTEEALRASREAGETATYRGLMSDVATDATIALEAKIDQGPKPNAHLILSRCKQFATRDYQDLKTKFADLNNDAYKEDIETVIQNLAAVLAPAYKQRQKDQKSLLKKVTTSTSTDDLSSLIKQSLLQDKDIQNSFTQYTLRPLTEWSRSPSNIKDVNKVAMLFELADARMGYAQDLFGLDDPARKHRDIMGSTKLDAFHDLKLALYLSYDENTLGILLDKLMSLKNLNTSVLGIKIDATNRERLYAALIDKKTQYANTGELINVAEKVFILTGKSSKGSVNGSGGTSSGSAGTKNSGSSSGGNGGSSSPTRQSPRKNPGSPDPQKVTNTTKKPVGSTDTTTHDSNRPLPTTPKKKADTQQDGDDTNTNGSDTDNQNTNPSNTDTTTNTDTNTNNTTDTPKLKDADIENPEELVTLKLGHNDNNRKEHAIAVMHEDVELTKAQLRSLKELQKIIGSNNYLTLGGKKGSLFIIENFRPEYANSPNYKNPTNATMQKNNIAMKAKRDKITDQQLKDLGRERVKGTVHTIKWIGKGSK